MNIKKLNNLQLWTVVEVKQLSCSYYYYQTLLVSESLTIHHRNLNCLKNK